VDREDVKAANTEICRVAGGAILHGLRRAVGRGDLEGFLHTLSEARER
jgi:hypothetical protein